MARETLQATVKSLASLSLSSSKRLAEYHMILWICCCLFCLLDPSALLTTGFEADFLTYCLQRNIPARASLCPYTMNETQGVNLIFLLLSYPSVPFARWSLLEPTDSSRLPAYDICGKDFNFNLDGFFSDLLKINFGQCSCVLHSPARLWSPIFHKGHNFR